MALNAAHELAYQLAEGLTAGRVRSRRDSIAGPLATEEMRRVECDHLGFALDASSFDGMLAV